MSPALAGRVFTTGPPGKPVMVFTLRFSGPIHLPLSDGMWKVKVTQLCLTLLDPMDCSLPGSSVHGILQTRILEWLAILFSRESSHPGIKFRSPALQADSVPSEPPGKTRQYVDQIINQKPWVCPAGWRKEPYFGSFFSYLLLGQRSHA